MTGQVTGLRAFLLYLFISDLGGLLIKFAGKRKLEKELFVSKKQYAKY